MGIAPLFSSAPRIELHFGGQRIAYAIGLNINVSVNVQPINILGEFGMISTEPAFYNTVTGTMQIIRLIDTTSLARHKAVTVDGVAPGLTTPTGGADTLLEQNITNQQGIKNHLDPRSVLASKTFDIDLKLKVPKYDGNTLLANEVTPATDDPADTLQTATEVKQWMRIKDCRLTSRSINISVGQLVNEPVNFQGLLATSFTADNEQEIMKTDVPVSTIPAN